MASDSERRLQADLFKDYQKSIRPVLSADETLQMNFGLSITQLLNVDEKNQIIQISVWMPQHWHDYRLQWNPDNYSGIPSMVINFDLLWYPDMALYNSADGRYDLPMSKNARVSSDGTVNVAPPAILSSPCVIDIEYFPFDEQRCSLKFGTWEYNGNETVLHPLVDHVVKEDFLENVEWEIIDSRVTNLLKKYPCCPYIYSNLVYTLVIRRRPLYYIVNMVVPCLFMSFITLFVFYLPPDSGEKMTLSISILLALSVLNLIIAEIMPPTSETTPLLVKYILFCMLIVMTSIVSTIVVLNVHHRTRNTHAMPKWVRKIFIEFLPKYLCMKTVNKATRYNNDKLAIELRDLVFSDSTIGVRRSFSNETETKTNYNNRRSYKNGGFRVRRKDSSSSRDDYSTSNCICPIHGQAVTMTTSFKSDKMFSRQEIQRKLPVRSQDSSSGRSDSTETDALLRRQESVRQNSTSPETETQSADRAINQGVSDSDFSNGGNNLASLTTFQRKLLGNIGIISKYVKREEDEYDVREDWKYVAMVMDRILLVLFIAGYISGNCIVMLLITGTL
ncbi:acetylcholine receptor subunit alpha-like [Glandiceps talaboti]